MGSPLLVLRGPYAAERITHMGNVSWPERSAGEGSQLDNPLYATLSSPTNIRSKQITTSILHPFESHLLARQSLNPTSSQGKNTPVNNTPTRNFFFSLPLHFFFLFCAYPHKFIGYFMSSTKKMSFHQLHNKP